MNINYQLKYLNNCNYNLYNYQKNKYSVFTFLKNLDKSEKKISSLKIQKILKNLQTIIKKLQINQAEIKNLKSRNIFIYSLSTILNIFRKILFVNCKINDIHKLNKKIIDKLKNRNRLSNSIYSAIKPIEKLKNAVKKLQRGIAIGMCVKAVIPLEKNYWPEAVGIRIRIGKKSLSGHVYMGDFSNFLAEWREGLDHQRKPFSKKFSFENYLNQVVVPRLTQKNLQDFKTKLSIVEYYTSEELNSLEVHIDSKGSLYTTTPVLNAWVNLNSTDQIYSDFFNKCISKGAIDQHYLIKDQIYIYVLDHKGRLYIQIKNRGKTNHTSLSNGQAILAAGRLTVREGKITELDCFSGHYKPTKAHLITLLDLLKRKGINIEQIKLTYVNKYDVQPWDIKNVLPGTISSWVEKNRNDNESEFN